MSKYRVIYWAVAVLSIVACTKQEPSTTAALSSQKSAGRLSVKIVPEVPTVMSDLQAVISCTGNPTYEWTKNKQVIPGETTGWLSKAIFVRGDDIAVTVKCEGQEGTSVIRIVNCPPRIVSVPFTPEDIHAGADITVKPAAIDPDGDDVGFTYRWMVNGNEIDNNAPVLSAKYFKRGDEVNLTVIPFDREEKGAPFVSAKIVIPNGAPQFLSTPPKEMSGAVYIYKVVAQDPDGDTITYSLDNAPDGMTIDTRTGEIKWPINEKSSGTHVIEISARDSEGLKTIQKYTLSITFPEGGAK